MTIRLYSIPVRCGNIRFRGYNNYGVIFVPFCRGILVWQSPHAGRKIPLLETLLALPAKLLAKPKTLFAHMCSVLSHMHCYGNIILLNCFNSLISRQDERLSFSIITFNKATQIIS